MNIALYGPGQRKRWAMTERSRGALQQHADSLIIGPSRLSWDGRALDIEIDEISVPLPSHIRGRIRLFPRGLADRVVDLDARGAHRWQPIAPSARVEVSMSAPELRWSGEGYLDSNAGDSPVEDAIQRWHWSRTALHAGTSVIYDIENRDGDSKTVALNFSRNGEAREFELPPRCELPKTGWRISRATRAASGDARIERTFEDTPFYARSLLRTRILGQEARGMHESLDLDRFRHRVVQAMLPFRMPRRAN